MKMYYKEPYKCMISVCELVFFKLGTLWWNYLRLVYVSCGIAPLGNPPSAICHPESCS